MNDSERDVAIRLRVIDQELGKMGGAQATVKRFNDEAVRGFAGTSRGAKAAERDMSHMSSAITSQMSSAASLIRATLGGLTVASFAAAGRAAINTADNINDMSIRLGISTEALSQYSHVAKMSGASFDSLTMALKFSQRAIAEAATKTGGARTQLRALGLDAKTLAKMRPEEAFEAIGDAISRLPSAAAKTSAAMRLFGRTGTEMIPVFAGGADAVRAMREEADRLGVTLDKATAEKAARANDAIDRMSASVKGLTREIAIGAAPALERLGNGLSRIVADGNTRRDYRAAAREALARPIGDATREEFLQLAGEFDVAGKLAATRYWNGFVEESKKVTAGGGLIYTEAYRAAQEAQARAAEDLISRQPTLKAAAKSIGIDLKKITVSTAGAQITVDKSADELRKEIEAYYEGRAKSSVEAGRAAALTSTAQMLGIEIKKIGVSTTGAQISVDRTADELMKDIEARYQRNADLAKQPMINLPPKPVAEVQGPWAEMSRSEILTKLADRANDFGDAGQRALTMTEQGVLSLGSAINNSLMNALGDAKAKLLDIGMIGKSIFGTILGGLINMGIGYAFPALKPVLGLKALGGPVPAYGPQIVGEYGPELFVPRTSGSIVPSNKASRAMSGGGDQAVHIDARTTIYLPRSSVIMLDSPAAVRRLAESVTRVQETKIRRTYRSRANG